MDKQNIILSLLLLIAVIIPPQKNMGAKGFMNNWDRYIEKPIKRLSPSKLIQFRYKISDAPINIITYLTFLVDFADWVMCILMLPCALLLKDKSLDISFLIFALLYMTINLPVGIIRTVCSLKISKKQKVKLNTEKYVAMQSVAEAVMRKPSSEYQKAMQEHKEYVKITEPFLKDFKKCIKNRKGVQYISEDDLRWSIDRIIPKYKKHLTYNVSSKKPQEKILTICLVKSSKILLQIPIKKD